MINNEFPKTPLNDPNTELHTTSHLQERKPNKVEV